MNYFVKSEIRRVQHVGNLLALFTDDLVSSFVKKIMNVGCDLPRSWSYIRIIDMDVEAVIWFVAIRDITPIKVFPVLKGACLHVGRSRGRRRWIRQRGFWLWRGDNSTIAGCHGLSREDSNGGYLTFVAFFKWLKHQTRSRPMRVASRQKGETEKNMSSFELPF
jgi:hypothetical protein